MSSHRTIPFAVAALLLFASAVSAQSLEPTQGAVYHKPAKAGPPEATVRPPSLSLSLPPADVASLPALQAGDRVLASDREGPQSVGLHRRLTLAGASQTTRGSWTHSAAGPLWRLQVISREAIAMRVHFRRFDVGEGRVWVHASDGQIAGPYRGTGLFTNGEFWSDVIFGEELTIEYQPADARAALADPPFEVREVSHIWRDPREWGGAPSPDRLRRLVPGAKAIARTGSLDRANQQVEAACHLDVTCSPDWAQTARGVGMILFERDGATRVCSGSLLITRDRTFDPYYLTAAHCLKSDSVARTVLSFWGFQSSECDGPPPELRDVPRTSSGSRLLATLGDFGDPKGDITFLEILGELPGGVFFQGWDPNRQPLGTRVVGIHHPRGAYKRISAGTIVPDTIFDTDDEVIAMVAETQGRTERGSSGSGLFSEPGVLVGALSFGLKTDDVCALDPSPAGYTHFSTAFPVLAPFLESGGTQPPPPADPPTVLLPDQPERFSFGPEDGPTVFIGSNSFVLEVPDNAERVTLTLQSDNASVDADLHARFDEDVAVANGEIVSDYAAEGDTGNETLVIDGTSNPSLRAGSLFISIALFTPNAVSSGTLTATIETAAPPPLPTGETLISGQSTPFRLPPVDGPTLFEGQSAYRIDVPAGASQLDVSITTSTAGVDVDLHLRRDQPPAVVDGRIVSDFSSTGLTGEELVTLTADGGLAPGTYFAALALWTENTIADGAIQADLLTEPGPDPGGAQLLTSGQPGAFSVVAVSEPTFFTDVIFAVDVPQGATRLTVELATDTPNVDMDLFVRLAQAPEVQDRRVVANYSAEGLTGMERIVVDSGSSPPLQAGRYFIGLAVFTEDVASSGRVTATVEAGEAPVRITAVTNAASFEAGAISAGQITTLFGAGMGPGVGVQPGLDTSGRLPTFAGNAVVLMGGAPSPLFFVRGDQINAQAPMSIAGRGQVDVVVVHDGTVTNSFQIPVREATPALFGFSDGSNRIIALNSDGSINSPANPARRGDFVVLFATGLGPTDPFVEAGVPAPSDPLATARLPIRIRFGGAEATPFFAGLAPGFAGLFQLNVFVPDNAPAGAAITVEILAGGFAGGVLPTIAVE